MRLSNAILCAAFLLASLLPLPAGARDDYEFLEGPLQAVRMEDRTVVMEGVRVYVPEGVADLGQFSAGDRVVFEYQRENGRLTALLLRRYEEG